MEPASALCRLAAPLSALCSSGLLPAVTGAALQGFNHAATGLGTSKPHAAPHPGRSGAGLAWRQGHLAMLPPRQQPMGSWVNPWGAARRLLSTATPVPPAPPQAVSQAVATAQDVLHQVQMKKLREELETVAEQRLWIPYSQYVEVAKQCGASSDEQAHEYCQVLHRAGLILRTGDIVYLRADEVAEMVMLMLPGGRADAEAKLARIETELSELDKTHTAVEKRSHRLADALLGVGFLVLVTQFFAFIWLTWWELSWDVMEPIAYIITLFYSIVGYVYFLWTRHAFDLGPISEHWSQRFKAKHMAKLQFNADRYDFLKELQERYKRHLAHTRIQA